MMKRCVCSFLASFLWVSSLSAQILNPQSPARLVGWWTMDEAAGATTLSDSSGYGRTATLGTGVTVVDGRFGKAAYFDGTTAAWARFTSAPMSNFTFAAWVYMNSTNGTFPRIFQLPSNVYYHMPYNAPGQFTFGVQGPQWTSNGTYPFTISTSKWVHAAVVYRQVYTNDTDRIVWPTFFINGLRCGTPGTRLPYAGTVAGGTAYIGNSGVPSIPSENRALDGLLDDVRIYDQALSDKEILDLYQHCPASVDAGLGQTCYRNTAALHGRLVSSNPYSHEIAATSVWSVVSAPSGVPPAFDNASLPATSVTLPEAGTYVFRLTALSELGTVSNEVTVVRATGEAAGNAAPAVTALWASTNTVFGTGAPLAATVTDDGNPGATRVRWSKVSGPGGVFFDNAFTNTTTAYFSTNGTYVVQLEADDGVAIDTDSITVTVALPSGDLSSGLIHWWRMDENPDLTSSYDSAGANTLTLLNQTLLQPGKTGYGLRFPSYGAYARATTIFTNAECFTFSLWLYFDAAYTNNPGKRIFDYGTTRFFMYINPDKVFLATHNLAGTADYSWTQQNYTLASNQWVHLAVLYDRRPTATPGLKQTFYINGRSTGSTALGGAFAGSKAFVPGTGEFRIGGNSSGRNFDGVFDDIRVYDRLLTDEEVRLLATDPDNNHAPVIEAQEAVTTKVMQPVSSLATVYDDGQPLGQALTTHWSVTSGDADKVQFANSDAPDTAVTITQSGEYVLTLTASDGELQNAVNVRVTATPTGTLLMVQ